MKKHMFLSLLFISAFLLTGLLFPKYAFAGAYAGDRRADFYFVENPNNAVFEPYGYTKPPGAYNPGGTFSVTFRVKNESNDPRTTYAWMDIFQLNPNGCNNSDNEDVKYPINDPNGVSVGGTDYPDRNPGIDEQTLMLDEVGYGGTYPDGRNNPTSTNNRLSDCQTFISKTGVSTYTFAANETKEMTISIQLPTAQGSGGYYQYDVSFGPWAADQWWDINCFNANGSGCTYPVPNASPAGFIRMLNPNPPAPTPTPTPTPIPPPDVPQPPTGLRVSCTNPQNPTIAWDPSSGATGYNVRMDAFPSSWNGQCYNPASPNSLDACFNDYSPTSFNFSADQGAGYSQPTYSWWAHSKNSSGASSPTYGPIFSCSANCYNLSGPTTVVVGTPATYSANYSGTPATVPILDGDIAIGQSGSILQAGPGSGTGQNVNNNGILNYTWTPSGVGTYSVFCRAFNRGTSECRGDASYDTSSFDNIFACSGPNAKLTVNVVSKPTVSSITISQGDNPTRSGGGTRIAGNTSTQGGSSWLNPVQVTVNGVAGSAQNTQFYFAMYVKWYGTVNAGSSFVSRMQQLVDTNNALLLRYDTNGTYWVSKGSYGGWENITEQSSGYRFCAYGDCVNNRIYTVFPGAIRNNNFSAPTTWSINFDKQFVYWTGQGTVYTAAYVSDSNGLSAYTGGEIIPLSQ